MSDSMANGKGEEIPDMQGDLSGDSELCAAREFLGEGRLKGTFRFLELPPELRNRVYHFAAQDLDLDDSWSDRKTFLRDSTQAKDPASTHSPLRSRTDPDYRGLMQVCQSIRSEFRPLYLAHKNVVVHNAIAFLNAFHPLKGEAKPCGKLSLIVEFPGPEHTDLSHIPPPLVGVFDTSVYQPIDLCQLFYQCDIARAIQPNFRAANGSYYEDNSYRCVAWLNFLNNA